MDQQIYIALFDISLFILVAQVISSFLIKYHIPALIGQLLAGIIIGPYAIGQIINNILGIPLISLNEYVVFFSEFSVILLIFASGLEHGIASIKSAGLLGALGATSGAFLPFIAAYYLYSSQFGFGSTLMLGAAMGATSLAAVAALIEEQKLKGKGINFLVSASAVDDVVALLLLSAVLAILQGTEVTIASLGIRIIILVVLWLIIFGVSIFIVPIIVNRTNEKYIDELSFVVLFGLVVLMVYLGYSPIIAAFVAGVALANTSKSPRVKEMNNVLLGIFGSIFFVVIGAEVNLKLLSFDTLIISLELTAVASVFKWLGVFPFAYLYLRNVKMANAIAAAMIPRGETGLIIASIGLSLNVLNQIEFEGIVFMSLFTTLIGSIIFRFQSYLFSEKV
ncbi:MAG: cation:proton antiporter [Saccharolobus sp.]